GRGREALPMSRRARRRSLPVCPAVGDPPGDQVAGLSWSYDVCKMAARKAMQARVWNAPGKLAAGSSRYDGIPGPDQNECRADDGLEPWPGVEPKRDLGLRTIAGQVRDRPPEIGAHHLNR